MVIPTVPPEFPFWQDLAHCDYFRTSLKITKADICMVVGGIGNVRVDVNERSERRCSIAPVQRFVICRFSGSWFYCLRNRMNAIEQLSRNSVSMIYPICPL